MSPLDDVRRVLPDALIALDFDGTLAPIVGRPQDARAAPGAIAALQHLASRVGRLAVITGRAADTVVELGGLDAVDGLTVLGHYGLQRWSGGRLDSPPPVPGIAVVRPLLADLMPAGAMVEDKVHSLAVHTRGAADPAGAHAALQHRLSELAAAYGLENVGGRDVWELRPPGIDKGGALLTMAAGMAAVLVAGDDLGDLPMFAAARTLAVPAACVAVASDGSPVEVAAAADTVVAGPAALVDLLFSL